MSIRTAAHARPVDGLLRWALRTDAVASGAIGAAGVLLGTALADPLGVPVAVTLPVGVLLLAYAGFVWFTATPARVRVSMAWAVITINGLWVLLSGVYAVATWSDLTALGAGFVLAQAAAVLTMADLQYLGLRRVTV